ncbi:MAG: LAGLIDADG family homing endonuclease [Nanoarchaeota archaeon]|nr:LAGLIDADG family homing endonuclease [Nanoarchaeota archaeon]
MKKEHNFIYLAGLLDGEGYFGIRKHKPGKGGQVNPRYQEEIKIAMVEEKPIRLLKKIFGGSLYTAKGTNRSLFIYQAADKIACSICKSLLPYLLIKNKNAKILLKMRLHKEKTIAKNKGGKFKQLTKAQLVIREKFYVQCKNNNSPHNATII